MLVTNNKSTNHNKPINMKIPNLIRKAPTCLMACALIILSLTTGHAAAPALSGSLTLRPLTPTEISTYHLTNPPAQFSAGLRNVGIGEPVYVDAMVNVAIAPSNIVSVTWSLTNIPAGSTATLLPSPLGTNVPLYKTADRISGENSTPVFQLAGRTFFRPDVVGSYTVNATITTVGSGSTNLSINAVGATYLGITACAACHSGAFSGAPAKYPTYTNTPHASFFARAIDGTVSSHYSKNCISCHTVGFDTNSFASNGGFDDVASVLGWTFPSVLTNGNWANLPEQLKDVSNIQCENCHGPASQHMYSGGVVGNPNAITVSYGAGTCSQCHDSLTGHYRSAEWNNSLHSRSARQTSPQCVRCHTGPGFIGWATAGGMAAQNVYPNNIIAANSYSTNILTTAPRTNYEAITCQACHDPHDASNPHQLRMSYNVTLSDGTAVTNAGSGGLCMECHNSRNGSVTRMLANYPTSPTTTNTMSLANWAGGVAFGTHDSPQGDMLEGVNAITYGQMIPNAPHANVVSNTCAGCHMQTIASTDPAFTLAGGHTFKMSYTNSLGVKTPVTYVCQQCHGTLTNFDILIPDYVGYGYAQGIQTQVQILLNQLSMLMPPKVYQANPANYIADGKVKTSLPSYTNMPISFLQAAYNYQFVSMDGSLGVHNSKFAIGLLKASIANLTGISTAGGLPDAWETAYFGAGFATNAAAGPNAVNNTNGIPNWMMYALGLSPFSGSTAANGVVYINNGNIVNGATNTIAIYTAAEIAFNTVPGTTYQIQGISDLTGSWQNISTNIVGTGNTVSYVTPTRNNTQMFYRVIHTP